MMKVVIVDNNRDVCRIYEDTLNCAGYYAKAISSEEKALEVIRKEKPDLVLLDILMPHISGMHLLDLICSDKENKKTKVIILTELTDSKIREKAISHGACDYIIKAEVGMSELLRRLDRALSI